MNNSMMLAVAFAVMFGMGLMLAVAFKIQARKQRQRYKDIADEALADIFQSWDVPDWVPNTMPTEEDLK